jgi:hypothetical protein
MTALTDARSTQGVKSVVDDLRVAAPQKSAQKG